MRLYVKSHARYVMSNANSATGFSIVIIIEPAALLIDRQTNRFSGSNFACSITRASAPRNDQYTQAYSKGTSLLTLPPFVHQNLVSHKLVYVLIEPSRVRIQSQHLLDRHSFRLGQCLGQWSYKRRGENEKYRWETSRPTLLDSLQGRALM
jgi:hypothetical protein